MADNQNLEKKKEAPSRKLIISIAPISQAHDRGTDMQSDGGGSGRSDSNDNQNQQN